MAQDNLDRDPAIDFLTMSRSVSKFSDEEVRETLLEAANLIRSLRIIIDAKIDTVLNGKSD